MNENILFNKKIRNRNKGLFNNIFRSYYYESDKLSLKEKSYIFHYGMITTGWTTYDESMWARRMKKLDDTIWLNIKSEFDKDFIGFENSKK